MEIIAKKRSTIGKKVRILREEQLVPAAVFGKGKQSTPISLAASLAEKLLKSTGESTLLDIAIEGENEPRKALISEIQRNAVTGKLQHINFHEVSLKDKITANVPIEFVGQSPAVKSGEGILITLIDEIEVECLPANLPSHFEVDISNLNKVGEFITVEALKYDKDRITIEPDKNELLIKVDYAEQLEEEVAASVEEIEVTGEKPKEEGEETEEKKEPKEEKTETKKESNS